MEEIKFMQESQDLAYNSQQLMEIDEENGCSIEIPNLSLEDNSQDFICGDSGFDNLKPENYFNDDIDPFEKIYSQNKVFQKLFRQDLAGQLKLEGSEEKEITKNDVGNFFCKSSPNSAKYSQ